MIGIATGIFVLYDRVVRQSPTVFVFPRGLLGDAGERFPQLSVTNNGSIPILVSWKNGPVDNQLRVATDDSIRAIVDSAIAGETTVVVEPNKTETYPLFLPDNYATIDAANHLGLSIWWQFAQFRVPNMRRHRRITFRKKNLDDLLNKTPES